jgi:small GTP-binding protein
MDKHYFKTFKIAVIGSSGGGKTNILKRFIKDQFDDEQITTVGIDFVSKMVKVKNQDIKFIIWDTAGQ